ncbi:MAG TPA: CRISPR system precrRNA processing endoribonuclease RAMP protein Cas6 [Bryobacteraceae bacterium]|nr:CRISPR system precrRNA processing endoribonuclease RAMP protein Cas6 [Bryobacteraceae bacterium]
MRFLTPAELKHGGRVVSRPELGILFARVRDRIAALRTMYGDGPLDVDYEGLGERACTVCVVRCDISHIAVARTSTRTGQTHPLGGFIGEIEYSGNLTEFLPWLRAAEWTGVGRQTVWGKGHIRVIDPPAQQ